MIKAVIKDMGGLKFRLATKGVRQTQGSADSFHETLDGQGRALRIHVELADDVSMSSSDAITPWIVRHSAWLLNRYLLHDAGLTSYQRLFKQQNMLGMSLASRSHTLCTESMIPPRLTLHLHRHVHWQRYGLR